MRGPNYAELGGYAQAAFDVVRTTSGVRDTSITYRPGRPEQSLRVDRTAAADLGVPYPTVAARTR